MLILIIITENIEIKNNSGGKVIKIPFASADKKMEWLKLFRTTLEEKNRSKSNFLHFTIIYISY